MIKQKINRLGLLFGDILGINLVFLASMFMHYEGSIPKNMLEMYIQSAIVITVTKIFIFKGFQLYDSIWEYASIEELIKVVLAITAGNVLSILYLILQKFNTYYAVYFFTYLMEIIYVGGIRFAFRFTRRLMQHQSLMRQNYKTNVLIVGSGATASLIATEIKNHPENYGQVVGFIDDNPLKQKKTIGGVKVLGNTYDIYSVSHRYHITEIIIAVPTASSEELKNIVAECKRCDAKVRIMPGVREMIDGHFTMSKIRDVEIEDLLGREAINLNVAEIAGYIQGAVVMVTGGGGSIGSELCRQIANFVPKKLVILDNYENSAYTLQVELARNFPKLHVDVVIATVREKENIDRIIGEVRPNVIFHAAAHKHVPLMERSPKEALKNNTLGTLNVAEAAEKYGVERFVLISTDKAVNPTNIMGASKRLCEMIIQGMSKNSKTKFVAVRFGNVLGSNGSVIPLFKEQIKNGGPVTVTHKEIVRYFMTIPEAAQLVIQASAIADGGEIFVLDMGDPVRIYDLAVDLIKLSGLKPNEDIEVEITGLRPGEKLYEELLMDGELKTTKYKKIHIGQLNEIDFKLLRKSIQQIENAIKFSSDSEFVELIQRIVPTYRDNQIVNEESNLKIESLFKFKVADNEQVN